MNISTAQTCKIFDLSDRLPSRIQIVKQPKRKKGSQKCYYKARGKQAEVCKLVQT